MKCASLLIDDYCPDQPNKEAMSCCGITKTVIPAAMGDDSPTSEVRPRNGAYCNKVVEYEANGAVYLYSSDGLYTKLPQAEGSSYELPIASASTLGGIKVGENLSIDTNGVLSATGGGDADTYDVTSWLMMEETPTVEQYLELYGAIRSGKLLRATVIDEEEGEAVCANVEANAWDENRIFLLVLTTTTDQSNTYPYYYTLDITRSGDTVDVETYNGTIPSVDVIAQIIPGLIPKASASTLGGVKIGDNLSITEDGVLNATGGGYELPIASTSTLGGVKVGTGLSINSSGVLSVPVDASLSSSSTNPVQNRAVYAAIGNIETLLENI